MKYGFISADDHAQEHPQVWTSRMSKTKWGERIPQLRDGNDGAQYWSVDGRRVDLPGVAFAGAALDDRTRAPRRWDEVPAAAYDPKERLKALDRDGVDYSVLYPIVAGLAGETFARLEDHELELDCVRAYNDWLVEEWAAASPRFVPQCIVPLWPAEAAAGEIRRAVAKGHKGVVYPASPMELRNVPHINDGAYDPIWAACEELGVPLCFHSGASRKIQMAPGASFPPAAAAAFGDITRSVSSIAIFANFILSRILHRFPKLKVVFAETSLGWGAYEIEYADYQSAADGLPGEGYPLKPSELFARQCYFTCWYDRESVRVRRYLGSKNILWSTQFPLATSCWPESRERLTPALASVPEDEKRQMLWENAAKLYGLEM